MRRREIREEGKRKQDESKSGRIFGDMLAPFCRWLSSCNHVFLSEAYFPSVENLSLSFLAVNINDSQVIRERRAF